MRFQPATGFPSFFIIFSEGFPGRNSRAISMLSLLLLNTPHNINIHNLYNRPEEEC